jgi:RsmE family RNA methyltransferase
LERFGKVALAAIKQCDNAFLPRIHAILDLIPTLTVIRDAGYAPVLCSERCPDIWLYDLAPELLALPCFIIGPEGGFSKSEFDFLSGEGLPEISIGYLITRADTAAVSIAAQWLAYANKERAKGTI